MPITPGGWRRKAREGRSASRREDPIHLGAATRQRGGAIRRAERREQWTEAWKPRSGSARAETERLSASERPSKVRNRRTGPRGWWPGPKGQRVGSPDGTTGDGDTNSRRTKGRSRPGRISPSGNRVTLNQPPLAWLRSDFSGKLDSKADWTRAGQPSGARRRGLLVIGGSEGAPNPDRNTPGVLRQVMLASPRHSQGVASSLRKLARPELRVRKVQRDPALDPTTGTPRLRPIPGH